MRCSPRFASCFCRRKFAAARPRRRRGAGLAAFRFAPCACAPPCGLPLPLVRASAAVRVLRFEIFGCARCGLRGSRFGVCKLGRGCCGFCGCVFAPAPRALRFEFCVCVLRLGVCARVLRFGVRVLGFGLGVWVCALGFGGLRFGVRVLGFGVWGSGFGVWGLRLRFCFFLIFFLSPPAALSPLPPIVGEGGLCGYNFARFASCARFLDFLFWPTSGQKKSRNFFVSSIFFFLCIFEGPAHPCACALALSRV